MQSDLVAGIAVYGADFAATDTHLTVYILRIRAFTSESANLFPNQINLLD